MRSFEERKAEVLRRSKMRIAARRRKYRTAMVCVPLCFIIMLSAITLHRTLPSYSSIDTNKNATPNGEEFREAKDAQNDTVSDGINDSESLDNFSFSFTWGVYGVSSYDSTSGKLVKAGDATEPDNYTATYQLTDEQKRKIYDIILDLDITSYPDSYNPFGEGITSCPQMTLVLSVRTDSFAKTVTAANIALMYETNNAEGQKFLDVCKSIEKILTETDEWKALPEYEHLYC